MGSVRPFGPVLPVGLVLSFRPVLTWEHSELHRFLSLYVLPSVSPQQLRRDIRQGQQIIVVDGYTYQVVDTCRCMRIPRNRWREGLPTIEDNPGRYQPCNHGSNRLSLIHNPEIAYELAKGRALTSRLLRKS